MIYVDEVQFSSALAVFLPFLPPCFCHRAVRRQHTLRFRCELGIANASAESSKPLLGDSSGKWFLICFNRSTIEWKVLGSFFTLSLLWDSVLLSPALGLFPFLVSPRYFSFVQGQRCGLICPAPEPVGLVQYSPQSHHMNFTHLYINRPHVIEAFDPVRLIEACIVSPCRVIKEK